MFSQVSICSQAGTLRPLIPGPFLGIPNQAYSCGYPVVPVGRVGGGSSDKTGGGVSDRTEGTTRKGQGVIHEFPYFQYSNLHHNLFHSVRYTQQS